MKYIDRMTLQDKQAVPGPLGNRFNQRPLSAALRRALRETTSAGTAPLVALSLAGIANPAPGQQATLEVANLDGSNGFVLNGVAVGDRTAMALMTW